MHRNVSELRPTQFALGMFEVESKIRKISSLSEKELRAHLDDHPVPIVLCRNGDSHIIDHHHLVRACWELGIERVLTEVKADLSHLDDEKFWTEMRKRGWVHLFDQFGNGPHAPESLPLSIRGLADDPYRSLAWALREKGAYEKTPEVFCEFRWADFLRKKITIARSEQGFKAAVSHALELAKSHEARKLPGFHGD